MYKFVLVVNESKRYVKPLEYNNWMLLVSTIEELNDFTEKYDTSIQREAFENLLTSHMKNTHITNKRAEIIDQIAKNKDMSIINASMSLGVAFYNAKVKALFQFGQLCINSNGGFFPLTEDYRIVEEMEREEMVFPDYSPCDVKIFKWGEGKHWYAKIGNMDVVDRHGNQHWNTREGAQLAADWYLKEVKKEK